MVSAIVPDFGKGWQTEQNNLVVGVTKERSLSIS